MNDLFSGIYPRSGVPAPEPPAWRHTPVALVIAQTLGLFVVALPTFAQTTPSTQAGIPRSASPATEANSQISAATVTCTELKSRLRQAGTLVIASGPGGGDFFHAQAPQCEFWQRVQFSYVVASDGWCGVGYVCATKFQGGR